MKSFEELKKINPSEFLGLSVRASNVLRNMKIGTLEDLVKLEKLENPFVYDNSSKGLRQIRASLLFEDLHLNMNEEDLKNWYFSDKEKVKLPKDFYISLLCHCKLEDTEKIARLIDDYLNKVFITRTEITDITEVFLSELRTEYIRFDSFENFIRFFNQHMEEIGCSIILIDDMNEHEWINYLSNIKQCIRSDFEHNYSGIVNISSVPKYPKFI